MEFKFYLVIRLPESFSSRIQSALWRIDKPHYPESKEQKNSFNCA